MPLRRCDRFSVMRGHRILIVDHEPEARGSLVSTLTRGGFRAEEAASGAEAMDAIHTRGPFDAVLLDDTLRAPSSTEVIDGIRRIAPETSIIMMAAFSSVQGALEAMKRGAVHVTPKPVDAVALEGILAGSTVLAPVEAAGKGARGLARLIGSSVAMQALRFTIQRVAASPVNTVLLTGESGSGKDVAARAIHEASPRARRPFVNITCSALPENLLESELFGHEAGAFTSASRQKRGLLEEADGGTVFLDEIAEMTPVLQAKLLRFLEERAFRRVGGTRDLRVDVRVVAATHRDLPLEVAERRFRQDLFYRLRVVALQMPALRERREDIEVLASHFIAEFNAAFGRQVCGLLPAARDQLLQYDWPGNVRELKHAIEQGVLLAEGDRLTLENCGLAPSAPPAPRRGFVLPPGGIVLADLEQSLVVQALEAAEWNQVRAGRLLGLNRDQIRYRIEKFGLVPPDRKAAAL
jgi:two-component system, NtrC family, response regulator AtoC